MRIIPVLAAMSLLGAAPAMAMDGTLTIGRNTLTVYDVSGGDVSSGPGPSAEVGGAPFVDSLYFKVDATGVTALMPLIDTMLKGGDEATSAQLTIGSETHILSGARLGEISTPRCDAGSVDMPLIDIVLSVEAIKSGPVTAPAARLPAQAPLTGCTIAIQGAAVTASGVIDPIIISSGYSGPAEVGAPRDYEKMPIKPLIGDVALDGKSLKDYSRQAIMTGTDALLDVRVTYLSASGPVLVMGIDRARAYRASLIGNETHLVTESVTFSKP